MIKFDMMVSFYSLCLVIGEVFISWCDDSGARQDTPIIYAGNINARNTVVSDANFLRDLKSDNGLKVRAVSVSFPAVGELLPEPERVNVPVPVSVPVLITEEVPVVEEVPVPDLITEEVSVPVSVPVIGEAKETSFVDMILADADTMAKIKEELLKSPEFIGEVIAANTTPEVEAIPETVNEVPVLL